MQTEADHGDYAAGLMRPDQHKQKASKRYWAKQKGKAEKKRSLTYLKAQNLQQQKMRQKRRKKMKKFQPNWTTFN